MDKKEYDPRGAADDFVRFLENWEILLCDQRTGRFTLNAKRGQVVLQACDARTDPPSPEATDPAPEPDHGKPRRVRRSLITHVEPQGPNLRLIHLPDEGDGEEDDEELETIAEDAPVPMPRLSRILFALHEEAEAWEVVRATVAEWEGELRIPVPQDDHAYGQLEVAKAVNCTFLQYNEVLCRLENAGIIKLVGESAANRDAYQVVVDPEEIVVKVIPSRPKIYLDPKLEREIALLQKGGFELSHTADDIRNYRALMKARVKDPGPSTRVALEFAWNDQSPTPSELPLMVHLSKAGRTVVCVRGFEPAQIIYGSEPIKAEDTKKEPAPPPAAPAPPPPVAPVAKKQPEPVEDFEPNEAVFPVYSDAVLATLNDEDLSRHMTDLSVAREVIDRQMAAITSERLRRDKEAQRAELRRKLEEQVATLALAQEEQAKKTAEAERFRAEAEKQARIAAEAAQAASAASAEMAALQAELAKLQ